MADPRVHRVGDHRGIAGEESGEIGVVGEAIAEPKFREQTETVGDVFRIRNGCGPHRYPVTRQNLSGPMVTAVRCRLWIRPESFQQRIIDPLAEVFKCVRGGGHGVRPAIR